MTTPPATGASSVPGVVQALSDHMVAVAAASPLSVSTHVGQIIGDVQPNFFCIGEPLNGSPFLLDYLCTPTAYMGAGQPMSKVENYGLRCYVRAWTPDINPVARLADGFALLQALTTRIATDRDAGGAISGGTWSVSEVADSAAGKLDDKGWGVVLAFRVSIANAFVQG